MGNTLGQSRRYAGLVALALALTGCASVGPSYQEPPVDWLARWQPSLYGQVKGSDKPRDELSFWWRLFNDPALNSLIEVARRENNSLRLAGLRIMESRALLGVAGSALYPQLQEASGTLTHVDTHQQGGRRPASDQDLIQYNSGLNVGWELDFWGKFRRGVESADAGFFGSIANQQAMQVLVGAQVASLYYSYRSTRMRIAIARNNAAIQNRSYEISERLYRSGGDSELDVQQAKTQYLATLATIPQLEQAQTQARNALCALLGRPPGPIAELDQVKTRLPRVGSRAIHEVPASLLLRRPDVRAALWLVAAQSAQIGIAEADLYPSISLLGSLRWSGDDRSSSPDLRTLALGPSFSWYLFDHGRIRNNVRIQDAKLQQLIVQYQDTVLQAARELDDAANAVVKTAKRQTLLDQSTQAAQRALELANARYREGYADFQRVLDAQRALFAQTDQQVANHAEHLNAVIALYKGLGGGWQATGEEGPLSAKDQRAMERRTDWGGLLGAPLPDQPTRPPVKAKPHE